MLPGFNFGGAAVASIISIDDLFSTTFNFGGCTVLSISMDDLFSTTHASWPSGVMLIWLGAEASWIEELIACPLEVSIITTPLKVAENVTYANLLSGVTAIALGDGVLFKGIDPTTDLVALEITDTVLLS
jgi:hypothetical protein